MHVNCPHCHNGIEVVEDASLKDIECPSCGSSFSLLGDTETITLEQGSRQTIGRFELLNTVGQGAFGSVWRANDPQLDRHVAIKIPRKGQIDPEGAEFFLREARAAAQLKHPNIVAVHEVGRHDGTVYIVSDYVDGYSLADRLTTGPLSIREAAQLCIQIAEALHHAHENGVIHRDLKPSNIMLDNNGLPHVMDFGLAKREAGEITMTMAGKLLGTPAYMSPEQAKGEGHHVDRRADVYSLGVILFELMTGELPFRGNQRMLLHQVIHDDSPSPRKFNSNVPRNLETICLKCMRKEPGRRFDDAAEVAADLKRYLEGQPIKARPVSRLEKAWLWCRRHPGIVRTTAAAIVVLAIVISIARWIQYSANVAAIERQNDAEATRLVQRLLDSDTSRVDLSIDELAQYRRWAKDDLEGAFSNNPNDSDAKLHAALAMLPDDESVMGYLGEQLLTVRPEQFARVRDLVLPHSQPLVAEYWAIIEESTDQPRRFRAACALASFDSGNEKWLDDKLATDLAHHLVGVLPSHLGPWRDALTPVRQCLIVPLTAIYVDNDANETARRLATDALITYLANDADRLFELLADSNIQQFLAICESLSGHRDRAIELARAEIAKSWDGDASEEVKDTIAKRQSNAAVLLYRFGQPDMVWPLLKHSPDPRIRSYVIHSLAELNADPKPMITRYSNESDVSVQRALLLGLGEFDEVQLPPLERKPLISLLLKDFENHPDAGLHAAARWLLKRWGNDDQIAEIEKGLRQNEQQIKANSDKEWGWYVNTQGQTFVILMAGVVQIGAPDSEESYVGAEHIRRRILNRRFAIATTEISVQNFSHFRKENNYPRPTEMKQYLWSNLQPETSITWYDAARYCNWLSKKEHIPQNHWCYEPNDDGWYAEGMRTKKNYLELTGYRLPTEAEWEFACRSGTTTARYFGQRANLLPHYAWFEQNSELMLRPVGLLKPNDFGLFDVLGNAEEWCYDFYNKYPVTGIAIPDESNSEVVEIQTERVLKGGCYLYRGEIIRSSVISGQFPHKVLLPVGFRPARTMP